MKRILLIAVLLMGACANESDIGASEGSAGSVGVAAEPLTCASDSTVCSQMKAAAVSWMGGGSWSWSGPCAPFATWNATGPGGRTVHSVQDINSGSLNQRGFDPSQASHFYVRCKCNSNGAYTGCTASSN